MSSWAKAADALYPTKTVAYTGTANTTTAYNRGPSQVLVECTSDAYVVVGEGVTATTANGTPITAGVPTVLEVPRGTGAPWVVSAIQKSAGGDLQVAPGQVIP